MSKIYTKQGDLGKTMLGNGKKVWKDNQRVKAYGSLDEVNCWLGFVGAYCNTPLLQKIRFPLLQIQSDLMTICAVLANPNNQNVGAIHELPLPKKINQLENWIDHFQKDLPPLKNFILPGGSLISSYLPAQAGLHLSRSTCRRAEREIVSLSRKEKLPPEILIYVNRLSDLLFVLARWVNKKQKSKEIIWKIS